MRVTIDFTFGTIHAIFNRCMSLITLNSSPIDSVRFEFNGCNFIVDEYSKLDEE